MGREVAVCTEYYSEKKREIVLAEVRGERESFDTLSVLTFCFTIFMLSCYV